jgi:hypothetical protein
MAIFNSYVSLPEGNGDVDHLSTAAGFRIHSINELLFGMILVATTQLLLV